MHVLPSARPRTSPLVPRLKSAERPPGPRLCPPVTPSLHETHFNLLLKRAWLKHGLAPRSVASLHQMPQMLTSNRPPAQWHNGLLELSRRHTSPVFLAVETKSQSKKSYSEMTWSWAYLARFCGTCRGFIPSLTAHPHESYSSCKQTTKRRLATHYDLE